MSAYKLYILLFVLACLIVVLLVPVARKVAYRYDAIDYPDARRVNTEPMPRMGGIAIYCSVVILLISLIVVGKLFPTYFESLYLPIAEINYVYTFIGLTSIFATGVIDDIYSISPKAKLLGQIVSAVFIVLGGLTIGRISNPFTSTPIDLGAFSYVITVIYLVAYANIINLIDGLDGLAAGVTNISSITMFILALLLNRFDAAVLSVIVAGSCLGFLKYNFHPASIFLGDCGSLLLGFLLGIISLLNVTRFSAVTTLILPIVMVGVPIIDTFSAIVRRKRAHVSIGHADKGHIHHRLLQDGCTQVQAVLKIYSWTIALCLGSVLMTQLQLKERIVFFIILALASVFYAKRLHLFDPVATCHVDCGTECKRMVSSTEDTEGN